MKILMIINPSSGRLFSKLKLMDALNVFCSYGHEIEVYITQSAMDGHNKVKEKGENFDLVIACGGDGTLNEITSAIMTLKKKPYVGYFPSGTFNDFGTNFNLNGDWKEIATRICENNPQPFDMGKCGNRYFDYVAAFGAFCDVPYSTNRKQKETLGNLAYILEAMTKLPEIEPVNVKMTIDNETREFSALFGLVLSGNRAAHTELLSKEKGLVDDGEFNILIVDYVNDILKIPNYLSLIAKQENKYCHWYRAKKVTFEFTKKTSWTLDGEEADIDRKVTIYNKHKALKMLK